MTAVKCPDEGCPIPVCDECRRYWGYTRIYVVDGVCSFGHRDGGERPEHFPGCHPDDAEAEQDVPEGAQIKDTEPCWHCGTLATRGACGCADCQDSDYIPQSAVYHCPLCKRWWAWMTGLNITEITFGAPS